MKRALLIAGLFGAFPFHAQPPPQQPAPSLAVDRLLDRILLRENALVQELRHLAPIVETYIQEQQVLTLTPGAAPELHPTKDHYFLGRLRVADQVLHEPLIERTDPPAAGPPRLPFRGAPKDQPLVFLARGFAQMALVDLDGFNRRNYVFHYVHREFLGEVRCLVFDVTPLRPDEPGRFVGRIWVEERDTSIVRFNGTYVPAPVPKGAPPEFYFHYDSWRLNVAPGQWMPAQIYVEEEGSWSPDGTRAPRFKAHTRIWNYAPAAPSRLDELTQILIENQAEVRDRAGARDVSPLESQRSWERQAEENVLARLEKGGFLAPRGPLDEVLEAVVNNLIVSANLNLEARCRVLLTTPIETFSIGHTIVISRGLIDVLPDEASLALMLADELSHIALGHRTPTQFAFHNQTMLSDATLLQRTHFFRTPAELEAAGKKTIEIMRASPYQKTANAGLFLKALASRSAALPKLLAANIGNQVANPGALARLAEFAAGAPALEEEKLEQIAALPLGSRVKLDPWTGRIELVATRPISLLSPREKMPFEVTPVALHLTRVDSPPARQPAAQ
jgi:hypothetical protein